MQKFVENIAMVVGNKFNCEDFTELNHVESFPFNGGSQYKKITEVCEFRCTINTGNGYARMVVVVRMVEDAEKNVYFTVDVARYVRAPYNHNTRFTPTCWTFAGRTVYDGGESEEELLKVIEEKLEKF